MLDYFCLRRIVPCCAVVMLAMSSLASDYTTITELKRYSAEPVGTGQFGHVMDMDGDRLIVGAASSTFVVDVEILERNYGGSDAWRTVAKLKDPEAITTNLFGAYVATSGDWAAVGNPDADDGNGLIYLYHRNHGGVADSWGLEKALYNPSAPTNTDFGAVAISGDTLVAGARFGGGAGAAHVFKKDSGGINNWGHVKQLETTPDMNSSLLGSSVDIDCDHIVVGAPGYITNSLQSGAAFVYERNTGGADNWGLVTRLLAGDPEMMDRFGSAVAIHGDAIAVGAHFSNEGKAYVFKRNVGGADAWGQAAKLTSSESFSGDRFGEAIDIFNETVLVGTCQASNGVIVAGAAYLFERNEGGTDNWGEVNKITASDAEANDRFGGSVAISAGQLAVGAYYDDDFGLSSGTVYIYPNECYNFTTLIEKKSFAPVPYAKYGEAGDLWGDVAVIGEPYYSSGGDTNGRVHILYRNAGSGDQWTAIKTIQAETMIGTVTDAYGRAVALWDDTLVVGLNANFNLLPDTGAAYVYERNYGGQDNWGEVKPLIPNDFDPDQDAGFAVDVHCDTIAVGAPQYDVGAEINAGAVFVYERNLGGSNAWAQAATLTANDPDSYSDFGSAVSVWGDFVAVGCYGKDHPTKPNGGAVYIFYRNQGGTGVWGQVAKIISSDLEADDNFGDGLQLHGDHLAVGAPGGTGGHDTAYVFHRDESVSNWVEVARLTAPELSGVSPKFGRRISIWEDLVIVGRRNNKTAGFVYERNRGGYEQWGYVGRISADTNGNTITTALSLYGRRLLIGNPLDFGGTVTSGSAYILEPDCFVVDTTADNIIGGDEFTSLREAIYISNLDSNNNCIILGPETYAVGINLPDEDGNIGGDYDIEPQGTLTIKGQGADVTIIDGASIDRVFHVLPGASLCLEDLSVVNGLTPTVVFGPPGGGIYNRGTTCLHRVMIISNRTGNGSSSFSNSGGGAGGGIYSETSLSVYDSTIAHNTTGNGGADSSNAGDGGRGGGVYALGSLFFMQNTTVSGNECGDGGFGIGAGNPGDGGSGGGFFTTASTTKLEHCTVVFNEAGGGGGSGGGTGGDGQGGGFYVAGIIEAGHSIISENTAPGGGADGYGTITNSVYNFFSDLSTVSLIGIDVGNLKEATAGLGPLGEYGGPTLTHEPLGGSPVVDSGDPAFVFNGIRDQRGVNREPNADIDIGAVEVTEDFDSDTIPDDWENANGMNAEDPGDAPVDLDFDDFIGTEEYTADTDPFDGDDALKLITVYSIGNNFYYVYPTSTDRTYSYDLSNNGGKTWIEFLDGVAGTGGDFPFGLATVGSSNRLFRIRAVVP